MSNETTIQTIGGLWTAGEQKEFWVRGTYFELLTLTNPVDVYLLDENGAQVATILQAQQSWWAITARPFKVIKINSASAQNVKFMAGDGQAGSRQANGQVTVTSGSVSISGGVQVIPPRTGSMASAQVNVTNVSTVITGLLSTATYLMIQNKDPMGNIWVQPSGGAATQANGIKIPPGGFWEPAVIPAPSNISAIGDLANNNNVVVVFANN